MSNSIYGERNPDYRNNIQSLIFEKNPNITFIDARVVRNSGKARMVVWMIDEKGHKFSKTLERLKSDKFLCCKQCARKLFDEMRYKTRERDWLEKIKESDYTLLVMPEHITTNSIIEVEDKLGYRYETNARSVKLNNQLITFSSFYNRKYLQYNLCHYKELHGLSSIPIKLVEGYSNGHIHYEFECQCGQHFIRSINKWMGGHDICNSCAWSNSSYERIVKSFLEEHNIVYKQEFTIYECRDINPLPFDFWIKKYNCLIEIDGQQHYKPVNYGEGLEVAQVRFIDQQKKDKIKDDYCQKYNIPLLRIPYWEFEDNTWSNHIELFLSSLESNDL